MAKKTEETLDVPERIEFDYEGTKYIMEFDRDTAMQTEKAYDDSLPDLRAGKITAMEALFAGSFMKHHPNIKPSTVDRFRDMMGDKVELYRNLTAMYSVCISALLAEPEEGNAISWAAK